MFKKVLKNFHPIYHYGSIKKLIKLIKKSNLNELKEIIVNDKVNQLLTKNSKNSFNKKINFTDVDMKKILVLLAQYDVNLSFGILFFNIAHEMNSLSFNGMSKEGNNISDDQKNYSLITVLHPSIEGFKIRRIGKLNLIKKNISDDVDYKSSKFDTSYYLNLDEIEIPLIDICDEVIIPVSLDCSSELKRIKEVIWVKVSTKIKGMIINSNNTNSQYISTLKCNQVKISKNSILLKPKKLSFFLYSSFVNFLPIITSDVMKKVNSFVLNEYKNYIKKNNGDNLFHYTRLKNDSLVTEIDQMNTNISIISEYLFGYYQKFALNTNTLFLMTQSQVFQMLTNTLSNVYTLYLNLKTTQQPFSEHLIKSGIYSINLSLVC